VLSSPGSRASLLRQELIGRNRSYATLNALPHVMSYGELPVWSTSSQNAANIMETSSWPAIEQFSESHHGANVSRKYMLRAGAVCQPEMDRGMSSILPSVQMLC
jgi:hypothetical protein